MIMINASSGDLLDTQTNKTAEILFFFFWGGLLGRRRSSLLMLEAD
jgi:hypothetical protein